MLHQIFPYKVFYNLNFGTRNFINVNGNIF